VNLFSGKAFQEVKIVFGRPRDDADIGARSFCRKRPVRYRTAKGSFLPVSVNIFIFGYRADQHYIEQLFILVC
jgi:hypothetical protein